MVSGRDNLILVEQKIDIQTAIISPQFNGCCKYHAIDDFHCGDALATVIGKLQKIG